MHDRILAPVYKNDGASFYRIVTTSDYLRTLHNLDIDLYLFHLNKFKSVPIKSGYSFPDRVLGAGWDYLKLMERFAFLTRKKSNDIVWLNRSLLSFSNKLDKTVQNIVYDFDDAIWLNGEANHCFMDYCTRALVVFAGNQFLADYASRFSSRVYIVPTSVDLAVYKKKSNNADKFNVGWIGSSTGLFYLKDIENDLLNFFEKHSEARLVIVSERYPDELTALIKYIDYVPWSRQGEVDDINRFSVGIMPLRNTDWERGKCSFKMLQYMACEVPVIISAVGMNVAVMDHSRKYGSFGTLVEQPDEWSDVLDYYYNASCLILNQMGMNARQVINNNYSTEIVAKEIAQHFKNYL